MVPVLTVTEEKTQLQKDRNHLERSAFAGWCACQLSVMLTSACDKPSDKAKRLVLALGLDGPGS